MASAFTHVGADTLRTLAVFVAALVSVLSSASGSACDAVAAMVVTVTIVAAVIPLMKEIYLAYFRIIAEPDDVDGDVKERFIKPAASKDKDEDDYTEAILHRNTRLSRVSASLEKGDHHHLNSHQLHDHPAADESILKQSNQYVLIVTCGSFLMFVIAEIVGALASNSLSLLGDAAAMSIDV